MIVGDAFAKPINRAIDEAIDKGDPYDTSSIKMVISSGVMWTAEVKEAMLDRIPQAVLVDAIGSTEGSIGLNVTMRGMPTQTARFTQCPTTKVFTEDGREVKPGSGEAGHGGGRRHGAARLLQGQREVGPHVQGDRR